MVVDTSALLAVFYAESDAAFFQAKLASAERLLVSAPTLVEGHSSVLRRRGEQAAAAFDEFVLALGLEVIAFDAAQAELAQTAYRRFGRGRHPAGLNLGDCFSYALALRLGEPLLFKGNDFAATDVLRP